MRRRQRFAPAWQVALGVTTLALCVLIWPGRRDEPPNISEATSEPPGEHHPAARTAIEEGRVVVRLGPGKQAAIGLTADLRTPQPHRLEVQAYGTVLDVARVTELASAYATARAQLQTAQAKAEVSRSASQRARSLGPYATQVQIEVTEGAHQTDQAALAAAQSQVQTLVATANQEWGPVIGRGIVERAPAVRRLIERAEFLVQVTLPPGERLQGGPETAAAEVPPQSARVPLHYVSPATRADQRIQGISYFYTAPGDSGLLPGLSTVAFITSGKPATGILVPEDAVIHWQGATWFYRAVGEDGFVRHRLTPDAPTSDDCFVVEDLTEPTRIVLRGAQALLSEEMRVQGAVGDIDDD